jgi:Flp pilus assembly pilin Flp
MSDLILHIATRARVARHSVARTLAATMHSAARNACERATREQTGQDMVEYAGVLLVVALIIFAVASTPIGSTIANGVSSLVNTILSGSQPKHS